MLGTKTGEQKPVSLSWLHKSLRCCSCNKKEKGLESSNFLLKIHASTYKEKCLLRFFVSCFNCPIFSPTCILRVFRSLWPLVIEATADPMSISQALDPAHGRGEAQGFMPLQSRTSSGEKGGTCISICIWLLMKPEPVILSLKGYPQRGEMNAMTCQRHWWMDDTELGLTESKHRKLSRPFY